jgi:hypothetical protein
MASAFFAFPSSTPVVQDAIDGAVQFLRIEGRLNVLPWPALGAVGLKLDKLIREKIAAIDFIAADITYPNFNVYYEIGYAIALGKPFVPTLNISIAKAAERVQLVGLFDTTGWLTYHNSEELGRGLAKWEGHAWTNTYRKPTDHTQPLFMLDAEAKTDFRNYIVQTIANSAVQYRSFDPVEVPRLSIVQAISDISASAGAILPLIGVDIIDSDRHNLRAAFLAGLAHGFGLEPLIIQYEDKPAPLDFRDFINTTRTRIEVEQAVEEYCQATLIRNQQRSIIDQRVQVSLLEKIDMGASAAENEFQKLGRYFVRTAEYARALRADRAIIAGRKGSGKSAIFFQAAEEYLRDVRNVVLELRPASHNLSELRENLLSVVNVGLFDHTIAAFWQYIIYAEIVLRLRELLLPKAKYNLSLLNRIRAVEEQLKLTDEVVAGDFTSRLEMAVNSVIEQLSSITRPEEVKAKVTNLLFENQIPKFRAAVRDLATEFKRIVILFDNLDKGWPARQVERHDVATVRHLLEVLNKIQRDLGKDDIDLRYLLFLRSDVYERLVEETADRGKYDVVRVDWSDPEQLEHLIRERVVSGIDVKDAVTAWQVVNPVLPGGITAMSEMIEGSLRRPRFLIDLCERALSFAINRGHAAVRPEDVEDALKQMSLYLVSDFGYEIRDVSGMSENLFYAFLGKSDTLTVDEVSGALSPFAGAMPLNEVIDLLLWYGFLGIADDEGVPVFIYDREYDFRRLMAERDRQGSEILYLVNPAFLRGLN